MYLKKYLMFLCLIFAEESCAGDQYPVPSEEEKKASSLISDGDQQQNGDPIVNYQSAIGLLSKPGQIPPSEMLLLAHAYVGLGNVTRATRSYESQDYFNRAVVILEQIPLQVKRNPQAKENKYVLEESMKLWQQVKNGLPPTS